jgi:mannan endo-1,4-beta-mannosidase
MFRKIHWILFIILGIFSVLQEAKGRDTLNLAVNKNASPEATALLELLYSISGKYTLTGQHNYPNTRDGNTEFAAKYIGKTPAVYSIDWGHAREGDTDSYLARQDIVEECIRQHHKGSLITICWHAVPPTAEEPVTFNPLPGTPPDTLKSVQGQLLDKQFEDVLTPGTQLHKQWCKQVDSVAVYLKKLQDAKVPVLWRPYHEMNGNWFWWCGRTGEHSTKRLYIQLFDRLVKYHKLNNLIWLWSVDRFHNPEMYYSKYFPGIEYVDVLTLDVYGADFDKKYYDSLIALSHGKPLALAEVGNPPKPEVLDKQPLWTFYATWAGMVRNTLRKDYRTLLADPQILFMEDSAYYEVMSSYRKACHLPPLPLKTERVYDFSGTWKFNEEKSTLDNWGSSQAAWKMNVRLKDNSIEIENFNIEEWDGIQSETKNYEIDGREYESEFRYMPRITTVNWSKNKDSLIFESTVYVGQEEEPMVITGTEIWTLEDNGEILSVQRISDSPWGKRNVTLVYEKEWFYPPLQ